MTINMKGEYTKIVDHYEQCFKKHGDNHKGVDWPNEPDLLKRFQVAYELMRDAQNIEKSLLDFGCGNGLFVDYLHKNNLLKDISYTGLDLSPIFIACCQQKFPQLKFICADVLKSPEVVGKHDFIVMNGVLTEKCSLNFEDMWEYAKSLLSTLFAQCKIGIAFNVMSEHVDWKRDDLFHVSFDQMARFLQKELSRNYTFRYDYGLYEFTTYVYR